MTALNAIRYDDAVVIYTDGASYDRKGIVRQLGPKCSTIEGPNIALAISGASVAHQALSRLLGRDFVDIDHIAAVGSAWFQDWYSVYASFLEERGGRDILVVMAGWSEEQDRARLCIFTNRIEGHPPFSEPNSVKMPLMGEALIDRKTFDLERDGVALVERQRLYRGGSETDEEQASGNLVVGGHVMLTAVQQSGITHRILKTWPEDKIGQPIRPMPSRPSFDNVVPIAGMNRAERRRMEKLGRVAA